jgi:hypothetical protein
MQPVNRTLKVIVMAALTMASLDAAVAQSSRSTNAQYAPSIPAGMEGAGGPGGAGGGVAGARVAAAPEVVPASRSSPYARHVRTTQPPPLDPSRKVYEVDCTKPFDPRGKGNLSCI